MKMTKITKKAISVLLSAFMLLTSLPVSVLAQAQQTVNLTADYVCQEAINLVNQGKAVAVPGYAKPYRIYQFSGGEDISLFDELDWFREPHHPAPERPFYVFSDGTKAWAPDNVKPGRTIKSFTGEEYYNTAFDGWYSEGPFIKMKTDATYHLSIKEMGKDPVSVTIQLKEGDLVDAGTPFLRKSTIQDEKYIVQSLFSDLRKLEKDAPAFTQRQFKELIIHDTGKLFGEPNTYTKFAHINATEAKGGEEVVTILRDGYKEVPKANIANPGDFIITNPGGEKYISPRKDFLKNYELIEGDLYKTKGGIVPRKFREFLGEDMIIEAPWGGPMHFRKGAMINVENISKEVPDLYAVDGREFKETYKAIQEVYTKTLNGIKRFALKIETKLSKKYPKYKGLFFRRYLKEKESYMTEQVANKMAKEEAAKKALLKKPVSRDASKKTGKRLAKGLFGGALFGAGIYLALTFASAPEVQAQPITGVRTRGEILAEEHADIQNMDMREKMQTFLSPDFVNEIIRDALHGNGEILGEMQTIPLIIQSTANEMDLTEEELADAMACPLENHSCAGLNEQEIAELLRTEQQEYYSEQLFKNNPLFSGSENNAEVHVPFIGTNPQI